MSQSTVHITAGSPLWDYSASGGWSIGVAQASCQKSAGCLVQLAALQYCEITLAWSGSGAVSADIDGSMAQLDAVSQNSKMAVAQGAHSLQVQVGQGVAFGGATITTTLPGPFGNYSLDDADKSITYTGFTASANAPAPSSIGKPSNAFRGGTICYTSSTGAIASFSFASSLLQIHGPVGPAFGQFAVRVDQADCGTYTATRHEDSGGRAVLLWMGQFQAGQHQVEVRNIQDGQTLALDYMVADAQLPGWTGGSGAAPSPTGVSPGDGKSEGNSSVGAIIGGVLAGLFVLLGLILWWRLHQYRKAGGEGSTLVACCGGARKPPAPTAGPEKGDFKIWPMIRSRPKYAIPGD